MLENAFGLSPLALFFERFGVAKESSDLVSFGRFTFSMVCAVVVVVVVVASFVVGVAF